MWRTSLLASILGFAQLLAAQGAQEPLGSSASNDTLLWGPYRPNLYFGVRPRIPKSLMTGLLWANADDYVSAQQNFRYTCEQHQGMAGYGWEEYDARTGGRQVIRDAGNKIDVTIDFIKVPGGSHGGSWAARVTGKRRDDAPPNVATSMVFYAGMEGLGQLAFEEKTESKNTVSLKGSTAELGDFEIDVVSGPKNKYPHRIHPSWNDQPMDVPIRESLNGPPDQLWRAKEIVFASFKKSVDRLVKEYPQENMPPPWQMFALQDERHPGNFHMTQRIFVGDFQFDILFKSASGGEISSETLDKSIPAVSKSFESKFQKVFKPNAPFDKKDHKACAASMLSNLVGGIGYFYGDSLVDRSYAPEYDEENEGFWEETEEARARTEPEHDPPTELFTSVPSRPFFPRGFLWDEGFHLIPIVEWDVDLAFEIIESWFKLMDSDGWIAREQILGPEARSKVPAEFQVQYPHYANPATLFFIVDALVDKVKSGKLAAEDSARIKSKLETLYPLLVRHYNWYRRTQPGDIKSYEREAFSTREGYRWRGRTLRHILPSGLDDYPRPQPPHPGELHLDLISWIGVMARSMSRLSEVLSETDDKSTYEKQLEAIRRNIDDLHWSDVMNMYCDATIDAYEEHTLVCHKGYISLFPFMTGLLPPTHKSIPHILSLISDPAHLWSSYGIRSLSQASEFYGTDENYWRSPIWVNMNFLIIRELLSLCTSPNTPAATKEQARKIYVDLRKNLVDNVVNEWKETGFAWEQYNPETGKGQRTQHFTGWTSLVVVIMHMPDLRKGVPAHGEL